MIKEGAPLVAPLVGRDASRVNPEFSLVNERVRLWLKTHPYADRQDTVRGLGFVLSDFRMGSFISSSLIWHCFQLASL